jgi:hypothetical protein
MVVVFVSGTVGFSGAKFFGCGFAEQGGHAVGELDLDGAVAVCLLKFIYQDFQFLE